MPMGKNPKHNDTNKHEKKEKENENDTGIRKKKPNLKSGKFHWKMLEDHVAGSAGVRLIRGYTIIERID